MEILIDTLAGITGLTAGISIALGFRPIWHQPKNFKIQVNFGIAFFIVASILLYLVTH